MQNNTREENEREREEKGTIHKIYEIGFVFVSSIPREKVAEQTESFNGILTGNGAQIIAHEDPELLPLAYTMIKKIHGSNHRFDEGYFGWVKFEIGPEALAPLKKSLDADENILRYLLFTTVKENTYLGKRAPVYTANRDAGMIVPESGMQGNAGQDSTTPQSIESAEGVKDAKIPSENSDSSIATPSVSVEELDKSIDDMVKGV